MKARVILDKTGRIVIPKPLREEPCLEPDDALEVESAGKQIMLRPARETSLLTKERGVWVLHTGKPLPASATDELLQRIHGERDIANLGNNE